MRSSCLSLMMIAVISLALEWCMCVQAHYIYKGAAVFQTGVESLRTLRRRCIRPRRPGWQMTLSTTCWARTETRASRHCLDSQASENPSTQVTTTESRTWMNRTSWTGGHVSITNVCPTKSRRATHLIIAYSRRIRFRL